jgi:M3 family oligoendopeptidase
MTDYTEIPPAVTTNRALDFDTRWAVAPLLWRYETILEILKGPCEYPHLLEAFGAWEELRRDVAGWRGVVEVRTRQNSNDSLAHQQSVSFRSASPEFEARDNAIKRLILESPHRRALASQIGNFILSRWAFDLEASDPRMRPYLEEQSRLGDRYSRILATMQFSLRGRTCTRSELTSLEKHPDRAVRREALFAKWAPFEARAAELDDIFDALVRCRTSMAAVIDEPSFTPLAYRRLGRIDFGVSDVRELRDEIREAIIPLAKHLVLAQENALGMEALMPWDEPVYEASPQVPIFVPTEHILDGLQRAYQSISPLIADFAQELADRSLMDIYDRAGKGPGAFCEQLPHIGMPFIFANTTGTPWNALTIAHETGHAFQFYSARHHKALELMIPTNETAEIHSLSIEFLLWPYFEMIVGDGAEELRRAHLRRTLMMLPYIAAIDHFQELVYEQPLAGAEERHNMWRELEAQYMPWRQHGGIPALVKGAAWQAQRHVYRFPFYYIDYAIAMCCALQLWQQSRANYGAAVDRYLDLCRIGGSLPFRQILRAGGLLSPFERGTLTTVAREAASYLE